MAIISSVNSSDGVFSSLLFNILIFPFECEFRTSLLNCKTENKCENLYLPDKKYVNRKLHSVLTYQTENNRSGCINRDENSVNNMIMLVNYYLQHKDRPEKFKRSFKFSDDKPIKDDNPNSNISVKCHQA